MINWSRIKYFKPYEFESGSRDGEKVFGSGEMMNEAFLVKLDTLRRLYGKPIVITSGYRTPEYNDFLGATQTHSTGRAVDIAISRKECYNILELLKTCGFTGIGLKQKGNDRFIHIDDLEEAEGRPRPHVWTY